MIRGFNPPRPMQSECRLCNRLFAYFQTTKRRLYCVPCATIEKNLSIAVSNDQIRNERRHYRGVQGQIRAIMAEG